MAKPIYLDYNGTTPHDPEVIEAMRPFFEEDGIGDGHLADIMHGGGVKNIFTEFAGQAEVLGQASGVVTDPLDVGAGVLILKLRGQYQPVDGVHISLPQLHGPFGHLLFQYFLVLEQKVVELLVAQVVAEPQTQFLEVNRLGKEVVGAALDAAQPVIP